MMYAVATTDKEREEQPLGIVSGELTEILSPDNKVAPIDSPQRETFSGRKESTRATRARLLSRSDTPYPFDFDWISCSRLLRLPCSDALLLIGVRWKRDTILKYLYILKILQVLKTRE